MDRRSHLWEVVRELVPTEEEKQNAWMKVHQKRQLDKGRIEKLSALRSLSTENMRTEADYFERNGARALR